MEDAKKEDTKEKSDELQLIIRVKDTDIDGNKKLVFGLTRIKGVGFNFSNAICTNLKYDPNRKIGTLSESDIQRIESAINDPAKLNIPKWVFNRQNDYDTGRDMHLTTSDLIIHKKEDIDRMGAIKSYKGLRHARGLKVRGQRTASTGRGQVSVGVQRKKDVKAGKT
ncbi:MAG: 30S ribosomal protein S13 [Candidatus Altiarchaeota archaeon]|nr:30S ribosomal protein S13 [Candidatus Altiarchaeota archaeon]